MYYKLVSNVIGCEKQWCCLFFFDIQILIAPLVSSNSSCHHQIFQFYLKGVVSIIYTELQNCMYQTAHGPCLSQSLHVQCQPIWLNPSIKINGKVVLND
jgi:hypothetical protein